MAAYTPTLLGYYYPNGFYYQLGPNQQLYFLYNSQYYPITPDNYQQSSQYVCVLCEGNQTWQLPPGTTFYVENVWCSQSFGSSGMVDGSTSGSGSYPDPGSQFHPMAQTLPTPPPPKPQSQTHDTPPERDIPPDPAINSQPADIKTTRIQPSQAQPPAWNPPARQVKCKWCSTLTFKYIDIRKSYSICPNCALESLNNLEMVIERNEPAFSEGKIAEIYMWLSGMDESIKQHLPRDIPLPIGSHICPARNKAVVPGYPSHGHIIGNSAKVEEGGCPKGHLLCKGCADRLRFCPYPNCGEFVAYQEKRMGCPAHPGDEGHCAYFNKACNVEGCTGGMWPKELPEEAKAEEEKAERLREAATEELPKPAEIEAKQTKEEQSKAEEAKEEHQEQ